MGQQEVYDYLKKQRNKWTVSQDIAKGLGWKMTRVGRSLTKMHKSKELRRVKCLVEKDNRLYFSYAYKLAR